MKKLNTTYVPDKLHGVAANIARAGGKVFLTTAEPPAVGVAWSDEFRQETCGNCTGTGAVGIQYFVGGPYGDKIPAVRSHLKNPQDPNDVPARLSWYQGAWYLQKSRSAQCPVCGGSGTGKRQPERQPELVL